MSAHRVSLGVVAAFFMALVVSTGAMGADTCEVTIEKISATPRGSLEVTPISQLSPTARLDLIGMNIPWAVAGRMHLESKQTVPFPPPGEVRFISLPLSYTTAIELRHLNGQRPDWVMLNRRGGSQGGGPIHCPQRYYTGFAQPLSKNAYLVVTVHPPGPIEQIPGAREASP